MHGETGDDEVAAMRLGEDVLDCEVDDDEVGTKGLVTMNLVMIR